MEVVGGAAGDLDEARVDGEGRGIALGEGELGDNGERQAGKKGEAGRAEGDGSGSV
ncbi:hypothetical protein DXG03_008546, partial [Asterophora parasitica]